MKLKDNCSLEEKLCKPISILKKSFDNTYKCESLLHISWPEYWSFSFSISLFNAYSGLISFRIDWFDLLAVQQTHKSLLQHCLKLWYNSEASSTRFFRVFTSRIKLQLPIVEALSLKYPFLIFLSHFLHTLHCVS